MASKRVGWPFQEGYIAPPEGETHAFTDYRWDDGSVTRRWLSDPKGLDEQDIIIRPFSVDSPKPDDQ
ncbi:MAG: hypothetical protein V7695_13050 [Sulfitobacter sp.]